jgi:hypothetical protein
MAAGRSEGQRESFLMTQEDAWERTARTLAMLHNNALTISASFGGGKLNENDFKAPDHFNAWLDVPGAEMPDEEQRRLEDEIIAEREAEVKRQREAAASGGQQVIN